MSSLPTLLRSKRATFAGSVLLAWAWGMFAYSHLLAYRGSGDWAYLLFAASETLAAALFVLRSEAVTVSTYPADWLLAIGGSFAPFFFTPEAQAIWPGARILMVLGISLQIAALLSLNRSYGLVAARRAIKTGGLYRCVRHPMYASYLVSCTGYLLANSSPQNLLTYLVAMALLLLRLLREERHLSLDAQYRAYKQQVQYRVLPWIF